jgi:hypothetical protein
LIFFGLLVYVGLGWFCVFVGVCFLQTSCAKMGRVLSRMRVQFSTRVQFPCKLLDFVNVDVIYFCTCKLACNCKNFCKQP